MNDETPIYLDKHHCAVTEFGAPLSDAGEEGYRVNKYGDNIDDEEEDIDAVYEDSEEEDEDDDSFTDPLSVSVSLNKKPINEINI